MERVLEEELMDDERQALAYARADFSGSNQFFVDEIARDCAAGAAVIDIGCGPGDVDVRLARTAVHLHVTGVDGSAPMIALAREAVRRARLDARVALVEARLPGLPFAPASFDAVVSKDLLHHLPAPQIFWAEVVRLGRRGAAVVVMDLIRPATPEQARDIVEAVSGQEDPILRDDFYRSLCAAFTPAEVQAQLSAAGLDLRVASVSNRHMLVTGSLP